MPIHHHNQIKEDYIRLLFSAERDSIAPVLCSSGVTYFGPLIELMGT